tara:strand:- start:1100 stop:1681 length:582 start_codon:yes stop_codon:yes gene_type:complete
MSAFDRAFELLKMPPNLAGETLHYGHGHPLTVNHYMVNDDVWNQAGLAFEDNPTLDELEALLGRTLTVEDFTNAPLNWAQRSNEESWWANRYPHEYQTKINRIGDEGRNKLRENWIREELERNKDDIGSAFYGLHGIAGVNLDELHQYMNEEQLAQVADELEYFINWENENPERAKEIRENNLRNRTSWGESR